jgi:hypothetical protein
MNEFYALVDAIVQEVRVYYNDPYETVKFTYVDRVWFVYVGGDPMPTPYTDLTNCLLYYRRLNEERGK